MIPQTLNTNEVKDRAGAEVEMQRWSTDARKLVFSKIGEAPNLPHRLTVSHQDVGSGSKLRRRSVVRVDKTFISETDSVTPSTVSSYIVLDYPIGHSSGTTNAADTLANLLSFCASAGANTTILYDGTGHGAAALLAGTL